MEIHYAKYLDKTTLKRIFKPRKTILGKLLHGRNYQIDRGLIQNRNIIWFYFREEYKEKDVPYLAYTIMSEGFLCIDRSRPKEERVEYILGIGLLFSNHCWMAIAEKPDFRVIGVRKLPATPNRRAIGKVLQLNGQEIVFATNHKSGVTYGITTLGGYVYCVNCVSQTKTTHNNKVLKYIAPDTWETVCEYKGEDPTVAGPVEFKLIGGIAEDDFYVVTKSGNVLHFDGTALRETSFTPVPDDPATCIGQFSAGEVYLVTGGGRVFAKKGDRWQELAAEQPGNPRYPVYHMVKYQGRVFLASSPLDWPMTSKEHPQPGDKKFVWEIKEDKVVKADFPEDIHRFAETLDVRDEVLLVAGKRGAALWDGTDWEVLLEV